MATKNVVSCTFKECTETFTSAKEMKKHKKHSDEHEYCHLCDIDFDKWEAAIIHKSQMSGMDTFRKTLKQYEKEKERGTFYANKQKHGPSYGSLKFHKYYCKFCGMEFHTESARHRHTLQQHPISQNVVCPGCSDTFPRAAGLIYHLEDGHCKSISAVEFKGFLQHKGLVAKLIENPTLLSEIASKDIYSYLDSAKDESETGGVRLGDDNDINWDSEENFENNESTSPPKTTVREEKWPPLPPHLEAAQQNKLTKAIGGLSVADPGSTPSAWNTGAASTALFPKAKKTPIDSEWQKRLAELDNKGHHRNILTWQFWNPAHPDYDPNRFWDPIIEKHRCPFPECNNWFDIPAECQDHINVAHAITQIRCPGQSCLKLFKSYHALIAHMENSVKCKASRSANYGQVLDQLSGGFLSHKIVPHPDLKAEDDDHQVGYIQYEATVPPGFSERDEVAVVGTKM